MKRSYFIPILENTKMAKPLFTEFKSHTTFKTKAKAVITLVMVLISSITFAQTMIVTSTADSGGGSLRTAIGSIPAGGTIIFDNSLSGQTIVLTSGQITLTNDITIDGSSLSNLPNGQVIISGNNNSSIFQIQSGANVTISSLILEDANDEGGNGGIMEITDNGSSLNISDSTLRDSSATFEAGAIRLNGNVSAVIERCLFTGNTAGTFGSAISNNGGNLTLINSLMTNNLPGGPVVDVAGGTFNSINNTIAGNQSIGLSLFSTGTYNISNTIIADNTINIIIFSGTGATINSNIASLCENCPTSANFQFTQDPLLAPLADNGGPTLSIAPFTGSPVINTGSNTAAASLSTDQRGVGFPRVINGTVDIGAFEGSVAIPIQPVNLSVSSTTATEGVTTGITITATADAAVIGNQTINLNVSGIGITTTDFALSNATITILNGQTTGTATFTVQDDNDIEGDETATLTLNSPSGGLTLGTTISQNIVITDNDTPCTGGITTYTIANGWDNGVPDGTSLAVIAENYNTVSGNIIACELIVDTNATLIVSDGDFVVVVNDITVNGALNVSNTGSIVQIDNASMAINNGMITVSKTTPLLQPRDFILLSSPMTTETNGGVYTDADRVFSIIPENFSPNNDPDLDDVVANFIDDNGDYLDNLELDNPDIDGDAVGLNNILNPTQGYLVFPQAVTDVGAMTFEHTYSQGTLNNGVIVTPITYNGPTTQNNLNLLGNPYPSAINTDLLISTNIAINEVYFWEHITPPNENLPGFNTTNFSMDDVSVRNISMGVYAANDVTENEPGKYMASGQGFAILAEQTVANTGVTFSNIHRVIGNNSTPRTSEEDNRLWLKLESETYTLQSVAGIAFVPEATPAFDLGYDSAQLATTISLFSVLESEEQLTIQGRETFDPSMVIQLGFSTRIVEEEIYTISIDKLEGVALEQSDILLIDTVLGTITNLKETSYTFASSETMQNGRFTLVFDDQVLSTEDSFSTNDIAIYPNPTKELLTISSGTTQLKQATIYDLTGRVIRIVELNSNSLQRIVVNNLKQGTYLLELTNLQGERTIQRFTKN